MVRAVSPGARLLRQSRLMSLPPPLPSTSSPSDMFARPGASNTHPAAQVIATPTSSAHRGDWGLKRNLPLKVTQKYLKYHNLDTLEHRTTFESAHGEVMVLRRWQEMDLPLTVSQRSAARSSAFDEIDEIDSSTGKSSNSEDTNTTLSETTPASNPRTRAHTTKWRYKGPFLQTMNPKQLSDYIINKVKPRRQEFLEYVRRHQYLRSHNQLSSLPTRLPTEQEVNKQKVDLSALRADLLTLEQLVISFLDLPTYTAPPATHPSAGLHYIRTSSHLPNHPFTGPRTQPPSLPGRQLTGRASNPLAGIAGLVAKTQDLTMSYSDREPSNIRENREIVRWYKPLWASVDSEGAVLLEVMGSNPPEPDYMGPGSVTAKPIVGEMLEREWAQREAERIAREQRESRRLVQRFNPPPQGYAQEQYPQGGYYDQTLQQQYYPDYTQDPSQPPLAQDPYLQQQQQYENQPYPQPIQPQQPSPSQPYPQQPTPSQPYPQHPSPSQPYPQQPTPSQPYPQHPSPSQPYPQQPPQQPEPPSPPGWANILRTARQQTQPQPRYPPQQNGGYAPPQQQQSEGHRPQARGDQFANAADEVLHLLEETQAGGGWGRGGNGQGGTGGRTEGG